MVTILKDSNGLAGNRLMVGAVLLAAGSASRMGHQPKCLLELDGVSLIRRQLIALFAAGVDEVVVVLGHYGEHIERAISRMPVCVVYNPTPDDGQVSSLRVGLQALSFDVDAVVVGLADQPLIHAQDIFDLMAAYKARPIWTEVVQPTVGGLPGNPVMFSGLVRSGILVDHAHVGCKQWQHANPTSVHAWDTANVRYRIDVDTPEDIEALALSSGYQLKWPQ
jgi:molybdenum cofactor cytidylyltransferase